MDRLLTIVQAALLRPVPDGVATMLAHVLTQFKSVDFVLTYGSILRGVPLNETLIDFYVVTTDDADLSLSRFGRFFGELLPPNVYYFQIGEGKELLRCKCSILTSEAFRLGVSPQTRNPYFWARFSQPCVLVHARDSVARMRAAKIVSQAIRTAYAHGLSISPGGSSVDRWSKLFRTTYRTEIRPENRDRASSIVDSYRDYYEEISTTLASTQPLAQNWALQRVEGKILTVFRLAKAGFTFQGGADYAAWKIARHTGEQIVVKDWQRKHPIIAGIVMLPQLIRRKIIR
jgi:hypothetical protein